MSQMCHYYYYLYFRANTCYFIQYTGCFKWPLRI